MQLGHGRLETEPGSLFIDCTASAVEPRPLQPVFQGGRIVLQIVRLPQPAFSAALTAYVEAHCEGDEEKNRLCGTVPFPCGSGSGRAGSMASASCWVAWRKTMWRGRPPCCG